MTYIDQAPAYYYPLSCGHTFRSLTPSQPLDLFGSTDVPDDETGTHWFYCLVCGHYRPVLEGQLVTIKPRSVNARAAGARSLSETEQSKAVDNALLRDRIARALRRRWDGFTAASLAVELGVSERLIWMVAGELGIDGESVQKPC